MKILVTGQPKTGTTLLYHTIRAALPADTLCQFEPSALQPRWFERTNLLVKLLLKNNDEIDYQHRERFTRHVIIVRDPRDTLISFFLYQTKRTNLWRYPARRDQFLAALEKKEQQPSAVSLDELIALHDRLTGTNVTAKFRQQLTFARRFHQQHAHAHTITYEQLITGDTAALARYLNLPLTSSPAPPHPHHQQVLRQGSTGQWRHWFTPRDVAYFRPLLDPYLARYHYDRTWHLAPTPHLDPAHGSRYVTQLLTAYQQRQQQKVAHLKQAGHTSFLITGQPKSGTTALFLLLKETLPETTTCLLEPTRFDPPQTKHSPIILAKTLLFPGWVDHHSFASFRKKVLIIRDPRDTIISALLWWATLPAFSRDPNRVAAFTQQVAAKQADPAAVSFRQLIENYNRQSGQNFLNIQRRLLTYSLLFADAHVDYFPVRYEDVIDGRTAPLASYLSLKLGNHIPHSSIARTKAYGNWRHWFTPDDVAYFRPLFAEYMAEYHYPDNWQLAPTPAIAPAHAADFITRMIKTNLPAGNAQAGPPAGPTPVPPANQTQPVPA